LAHNKRIFNIKNLLFFVFLNCFIYVISVILPLWRIKVF